MTFRGTEQPRACMLADGRRLHLQHGPIDIVIGADGHQDQIFQAYNQAAVYFSSVLRTLAGELDLLRRPCTAAMPAARSQIARHMQASTAKLCGCSFATPMIAVAGAVADHVLWALLAGRHLRRAYVNNGGDIALWLAKDARFDVGVCSNPDTGQVGSTVRIGHGDGVGGIATSGWRGRSFSLGVADAVTVLADSAATADTAATLIANAVDLPAGSSGIQRRPARELAPDSDLGDRLVTVAVEDLTGHEIEIALSGGRRLAARMIDKGLIRAAYINLQNETVVCEPPRDCNSLNNRQTDLRQVAKETVNP